MMSSGPISAQDANRSEEVNAELFGRIAILNGPPSVGKTSLARSLQSSFTAPWFHQSLDEFRAGFLERFWMDDNGTLFDRVLVGYLGAIREMARAGNNVIAEAVISPSRRELYASTLQGFPVVLVGVHCSLAESVRRERTRTDRLKGPIDLRPDLFEEVHTGLTYDFEVDTTDRSSDDVASELAARIQVYSVRVFSHHEVG